MGRLDNNKNVLQILRNYNEIIDLISKFTIVGDGELREVVKEYTLQYPNIVMSGVLNNYTTQLVMAAHDYLRLPSEYDGWGAVVNEALAHGTRVLCSDACGASILLDGKQRGESFKQSEAIDTIQRWVKNGPVSVDEKNLVKEWAKTHISGGVAAEYFVKIIEGNNINAPWID